MPKVRRIAVSSRVSAAKRASELEATTNIQRNRASAVVISSASPGARCDSSSVVPTSCSGMTPTCAPPRVGRTSCGRGSRIGGGSSGFVGRLRPRRWRRRRWPQRHAAARGAADLGQQFLGLRRRRGIQQVGQHRAAAVVGLDRHAALAARGVRPHQRPPGALMRPVDLQQPLRRRDRRLRLDLLAQQRFGDRARAVAQPLAFGGQPGVEGRVDAVEVLQQVAIEQGQRGRLVGGRPHHLLDIDPDHAGPQREMVARHHQEIGPGRGQRFQQPVDFLPQRGAGLFLRPAAPQQFGQPATQRRTRR